SFGDDHIRDFHALPYQLGDGACSARLRVVGMSRHDHGAFDHDRRPLCGCVVSDRVWRSMIRMILGPSVQPTGGPLAPLLRPLRADRTESDQPADSTRLL